MQDGKRRIITPRSIILLPSGKVLLNYKEVDPQKVLFESYLQLKEIEIQNDVRKLTFNDFGALVQMYIIVFMIFNIV